MFKDTGNIAGLIQMLGKAYAIIGIVLAVIVFIAGIISASASPWGFQGGVFFVFLLYAAATWFFTYVFGVLIYGFGIIVRKFEKN